MLSLAGIFFVSWTQTAELIKPDVLRASRFPSLFSVITRIIDVIFFQIWSALDGYEKLAEECEAIRQQRTQTCTSNLSWNMHVFEMAKKAPRRLYFLIGNKSAIMSRRPNCLGFTQAV